MALLFMESFDGYGGTVSHATKYYTLATLSTSPVRTGTHACWGNSAWGRWITPGSTTLVVGFALYWSANQQAWVCVYNTSSGAMCCLTMETNHTLVMRRGGSTGTVLETSAAVLVPSSWNFIEWKVNVADAGTWTVKVNGVQVLDGSGDTNNTAVATIGALEGKCWNGERFDDLYALDSTGSYLNDFIGDHKVECLSPSTGNGTNTGLTCSTGSDHGALVDELPANDDTDYNYGSTTGVKDTYNFPSLASTGTVRAVQVSLRAKKSDSATKQLAAVARENSTDSDGATQTVASASYSQYQQVWEKRPSDNANWTVSDVNGGEFGMKVVS